MIKMDEKIFKAYDIRGTYPDQLNCDTAYKIGRAFVTFTKCKEVVVGQDMRESSPKMFKALARGITDQGANVIDIGFCSTPYFYFGTHHSESGIMVTASHNPARYNGFKMCKNGTIPLSGDTGIMDIKELVIKGEFKEAPEKGTITKKDIMNDFVTHCKKFYKNVGRKLKIVIDPGNGMGGYTFPKVFDDIEGIEVVRLYFDVDMSFPNHEANPLKLINVKDLQAKIIEEKADLGVSIDGDCDRCVFIDEEGRYIDADLMTALVGAELLKKYPGKKILYDLRSSWATKKFIEKNGGQSEMCRVGHAFIKQQMREHDAIFAGELSGHFYFKDSFFSENTIMSTLLVADILKETGKKLSELVAPLREFYKIEETNFEVEDKKGKMNELMEKFKNEAVETSTLDGIKLTFNNWWFNVRSSNTEPLLRLNLEAKGKDLMEEKLKLVKEAILS